MPQNHTHITKAPPKTTIFDNSTPESGQKDNPNLYNLLTPTPTTTKEDLSTGTPPTTTHGIVNLLDEINASYNNFLQDMNLLTDFPEPDYSGLRTWYERFLTLRLETTTGSYHPVLQFLLGTVGEPPMGFSDDPRDWENAWYLVVREIYLPAILDIDGDIWNRD